MYCTATWYFVWAVGTSDDGAQRLGVLVRGEKERCTVMDTVKLVRGGRRRPHCIANPASLAGASGSSSRPSNLFRSCRSNGNFSFISIRPIFPAETQQLLEFP